MLEERVNPSPASFYWYGANANGYSDAANWYVPGYHDHDMPVSGDYLYVGNGMVSSDFTVPAAYTFQSLVTSTAYSGTISLQDETTIDIFYTQGGNIEMVGSSSSGNDLYVAWSLYFTGGNLNSGANLGTVHLTGSSTAGAEAYVGSMYQPTLGLGSTLSAEGSAGGGASLYLQGGIFECSNGAGINIEEDNFGQTGPQGAVGGAAIPNELKAVGNVVDGGVLTVKGLYIVA